jgi:hypothetical protein
MQIELHFSNVIEQGKTAFGIAPEGFCSIYMTAGIGKRVQAMSNAVMLVVTHIYKAVIASPAIAVEDASRADFASDNAFQRRFSSFRNEFSIDFSLAFKDAENDGFSGRTPASFTGDTPGPKVGLIHINGATECGRSFTPTGNFASHFIINNRNPSKRYRSEYGRICGGQIQSKTLQDVPENRFRNV